MPQLSWYLKRLQGTQPGEWIYRGEQSLRSFLESKRLAGAWRVPEPHEASTNAWLWPSDAKIACEPYVEAMQPILRGEVDLIGHRGVKVGNPPIWTRNPVCGRDSQVVYGKGLDYRDNRIFGEVKYTRLFNRHNQWVTAAQAFLLTKDPRYVEFLRGQIESWLEQNPYMMGVNWNSALEQAMRMISWSFVWSWTGGLRGALFDFEGGDRLRSAVLRSVYQQTDFIRNFLSRFSSANNHLIGELAGVYIAARTWPYWPEFERWGTRALGDLVQEAHRQNHADGVNKEQATFYQVFVLEFLIMAGLVAEGRKDPLDAEYWPRIERMLEFLAAIRDVGGNVPLFGDSDGCMVAPLGKDPPFSPFSSLLNWGRAYFRRPDLFESSRQPDDYSRWLLGKRADEPLENPRRAPATKRAFTEGGYFVLGRDLGTPREIRIVADAAPLGYLAIAGHAHADALSFVVSRFGKQWLVDPGTFCYQGEEKWRRYFRSTAAHNTLVVDDQDQSVYLGKFMWGRKARVTRHEWTIDADFDRLVASHDGYARLKDPVIHRRELMFDRKSDRLTVVDTVECRGQHRILRYLHFAEDCDVRVVNDRLVEACRNDGRMQVRLDGNPCAIDLLCGSDGPPAGWVSRTFGEKRAAPTIRLTSEIRGTQRLCLMLTWQDD